MSLHVVVCLFVCLLLCGVFDCVFVCLLVGLFACLFGWVLVLLFIAFVCPSSRRVFFDVSVILPFCRCLRSFVFCLLARSSFVCSFVCVRVLV